jgi:hypothetical protein
MFTSVACVTLSLGALFAAPKGSKSSPTSGKSTKIAIPTVQDTIGNVIGIKAGQKSFGPGVGSNAPGFGNGKGSNAPAFGNGKGSNAGQKVQGPFGNAVGSNAGKGPIVQNEIDKFKPVTPIVPPAAAKPPVHDHYHGHHHGHAHHVHHGFFGFGHGLHGFQGFGPLVYHHFGGFLSHYRHYGFLNVLFHLPGVLDGFLDFGH